jgi:hypothetical protein
MFVHAHLNEGGVLKYYQYILKFGPTVGATFGYENPIFPPAISCANIVCLKFQISAADIPRFDLGCVV